MNRSSLLFVAFACFLLAFQFNEIEGQFSFSLPGQWGSGKRSGSNQCLRWDREAFAALQQAVMVSDFIKVTFTNIL